VCIPPAPPDLNCSDIEFRRFPVVGDDPHGFDGDKDGIGCES
jgi:micrococcal nuclease